MFQSEPSGILDSRRAKPKVSVDMFEIIIYFTFEASSRPQKRRLLSLDEVKGETNYTWVHTASPVAPYASQSQLPV